MNFERALRILSEARVEFVLIGGVAMVFHGSASVTKDTDVCYSRTSQNLQRLASALSPLHPRLRGAPENLPFRFDAETLARGLNFTLSTDLGPLDLLGEVAGLGTFDQVNSHAEPVQLFGLTCLVLSLRGLIQSKRAAGRPRDLAALPELEALLELREKLNES
jgi:hypothetical protein